jgi:nucleotide-binding universal stress UspA family protein
MKVLFPTDGSDASIHAIKKTLPFLRHDYQIDIINVIDWGFFPTYVTFPVEEEVAFPDQQNAAQKIVETTKNIIEDYGYKVTKADFAYGKPEKIILDLIENENYDLTAMGSHGKKGISKWLGSLSRKIVTRSPIPTLIARPSKDNNDTFKEIKEILIATDGSIYSYNAIKKTINILNLQNSSVEVVTVKPGTESLPVEITSDKEWLEKCLSKQEEIATEILEESKKILEENGISPKSAFSLEGDAAEEILNYINEHKKDLVIMGSHGREGISDILLGSVSKRILDFSTSPVLIVPSKK